MAWDPVRPVIILAATEEYAHTIYESLDEIDGIFLQWEWPQYTPTGAKWPWMDHFVGTWYCQNRKCSGLNDIAKKECEHCGGLRMDVRFDIVFNNMYICMIYIVHCRRFSSWKGPCLKMCSTPFNITSRRNDMETIFL